MLPAHCSLLRQFSVSEQQLPTMHCEHGVPPGSRLQEPASKTGMPQFEPLQTSPTQHCAVFWHVDPGGKQEPAPHSPF